MNKTKNYRTAARLVLGVAMAGTLLTLPWASQGTTYSYTDLNPIGFTCSDGLGISGSQQVGWASGSATGGNQHAFLWSGTASSAVDLNPSGFTMSCAWGISGGQQVGWASGSATGTNNQAMLWSGTASSAVDLNPSGFTWSLGRANSGSQQIGYGYGSATGNNNHALLWSGTASSAVDLNPSGFTASSGSRISGSQQVGGGFGPSTGNNNHALLWSGTASSAVDLNPSGFTTSEALDICGSQQVGNGSGSATGNNNHALLWSGTASSAVDLNPSGFTMSVASGISGSQQVGYGSGPASGNNTHALLWSGTASSAVDLGSLLSSDYINWSVAEGIDANGNIFGYAFHLPSGQTHAILWRVVPPRTATATATLVNAFVVGASITDGGYGYTNTPTVQIIGGGGSGAQAFAVVSNGVVTSITITNAGYGYTNAPLIVIAPPFIPNPILGIAPMSFLSFSNVTVGGVYQLQQAVAWYWSNQPVSFTATNALYTQMVAGVAGGGEYRLALNPVPAQAFATPEVVNGFVVGATVTSGGSGYVTSPAVTIVGGGGTNATAVSEISGGVVTNITITDAGIDYTNIIVTIGGIRHTNAPIIEIAQPPAAAVSPTVLPMMRVDSTNLAPYDNYQIQFEPDLSGAWSNWDGGLFSPTDVTNSQYLFITNGVGFFRLQYVP
jgi:hypothetical protein